MQDRILGYPALGRCKGPVELRVGNKSAGGDLRSSRTLDDIRAATLYSAFLYPPRMDLCGHIGIVKSVCVERV
jgi:hypothetical protein